MKDAAAKDPATRIHEAATELFAEHGFEGVSVRDIAAEAGVTVGSINYSMLFPWRELVEAPGCHRLTKVAGSRSRRGSFRCWYGGPPGGQT